MLNSNNYWVYIVDVADAVVADIGGTSTDVGMLVAGFPRQASTKVKVKNQCHILLHVRVRKA